MTRASEAPEQSTDRQSEQAQTAAATDRRWVALDVLRGLSIVGMLLNLNPGAWQYQYQWLMHAKWQGGHLIDMVAPAFLFCIGAAIPLSFQRRLQERLTRGSILWHILWRSLALLSLGLLVNAYPHFDWAHVRLPGILQRIGLAAGMVSLLVLFVARRGHDRKIAFSPAWIAGAAFFVLLSYWALLYFVPVPGFGAPRFDAVGSWPAFVDRAVFGTRHMFIYWPVDGRIVFDPDGLLLVYPTSFNILLGALVAVLYRQKLLAKPLTWGLLSGCAMMLLALALSGVCPLVKNIWTSTFALFSGGCALAFLSALTAAMERFRLDAVVFPARVFGANPLLAYLLCFALSPLLDLKWIASASGLRSIRAEGQITLSSILPATHASFVFSLVYLAALGLILWACYQKRWFLKL